jgi:hypothetical protein
MKTPRSARHRVGALISPAVPSWTPSSGQVEDERQRLTNLANDNGANVASDTTDTAGRYRSYELTLRGRSCVEAVAAVRLDLHLGAERVSKS